MRLGQRDFAPKSSPITDELPVGLTLGETKAALKGVYMDFRRFLSFLAKVTVAHVVSYFVIGAAAYALLTRSFYEGSNPVFATFMRTPAEPELWKHVMTWFIPGQVLRGILMAVVLYPLFDTLKAWGWRKRFLSISGLYLVLGYWASAVAAPGTIDGLIYLRPEITPYAHLMVQPEIVVQALILGAWVALWMVPRPRTQATKVNLLDA
jgi:hypothetical protein